MNKCIKCGIKTASGHDLCFCCFEQQEIARNCKSKKLTEHLRKNPHLLDYAIDFTYRGKTYKSASLAEAWRRDIKAIAKNSHNLWCGVWL